MDFLTTIRALMTLQEQAPDLRWTIADGWEADTVSVTFTVSPETGKLMRDAQQMFAPR